MFPVSRILARARRFYPDKLAVIDGETRLTYSALGARVDRLAGAFHGLGLQRGDRVAILDVNSVRYLEAYYACAAAGLVLVPLNFRLAPRELDHILNDAGARVLLLAASFHPIYEEVRGHVPTVQSVVTFGTAATPPGMIDYEELLGNAKPLEAPVETELDEVIQIYYTSGTTGEPKGVCLTNRNMIASALDAIVSLGITPKDIWLHAAPLFHLVDAWATWSLPLVGGTQATINFEPRRVLEVIEREKVTMTGLPPTMINLLANHPQVGAFDKKSLRQIMYGGSPTPLGVLRKGYEALGCQFRHAYGITETSGIVTLFPPEDPRFEGPEERIRRTASAGQALPHLDVRVVDDAGNDLAPGQVGELLIAGPRVMKEYWKKPEATANAIRDGWYYSGDMGYRDEEHHIYVVDRKKDMIITGGENVYPIEVENVLSTHPAVLEVAVLGVPDDTWGEAVKAVVVLRPEHRATAQELIDFCRGKIAGYKIPKAVDFSREPLPKTGPGKIAKRILRDPYWAGREKNI